MQVFLLESALVRPGNVPEIQALNIAVTNRGTFGRIARHDGTNSRWEKITCDVGALRGDDGKPAADVTGQFGVRIPKATKPGGFIQKLIDRHTPKANTDDWVWYMETEPEVYGYH